jgi:hypothetical protein
MAIPFPDSPPPEVDDTYVHAGVIYRWDGTGWRSEGLAQDPVTLAGTPNYLTIAGQVITRGLINLASHVTGILPSANGGTGNGFTKFTGPDTAEKEFALPNANAVLAAMDREDQSMSGGARVVVKDLGNLSGQTITPDPGDRPIQKITNDGAGTVAPGSNVGSYLLVIKNTTGAGAITTSGWQSVKGDAFDTTTTSEFVCHCCITGDLSAMVVTKVA